MKEIINNHIEVKENARNSNDQFVEQIENYKLMSKTCQSWILWSGTNIKETLAKYVETILKAQKCLKWVYWIVKSHEF